MHDSRISDCVDTLCEQGCTSVRQAIRRLSSGQAPTEASRLSAAQRRELLRELRTIMAVYDKRDSDC